jgi:hypothetical protein
VLSIRATGGVPGLGEAAAAWMPRVEAGRSMTAFYTAAARRGRAGAL